MMQHKALNQLLCAALVNSRFCQALLQDPAKAVAAGYYGQSFALSEEEHAFIMDIQAQGLEDFAAKVHQWISRDPSAQNGNGHNRNGFNNDGIKLSDLNQIKVNYQYAYVSV